jgi:hypothetical protein
MRRQRPVLDGRLDQRTDRGNHWDDHLDRPQPLLNQSRRLAEGLHQPAHLGRSAAGQCEQHRPVRLEAEPPRQFPRVQATDPANFLDQRMANIAA